MNAKEFFESWKGFPDRYPAKILPQDMIRFAEDYHKAKNHLENKE